MCKLGCQTLGELERGAVRSQDDDDETKRLSSMWTSLLEDDDVKAWKTQYDQNLAYSKMRAYGLEEWRVHFFPKLF